MKPSVARQSANVFEFITKIFKHAETDDIFFVFVKNLATYIVIYPDTQPPDPQKFWESRVDPLDPGKFKILFRAFSSSSDFSE